MEHAQDSSNVGQNKQINKQQTNGLLVLFLPTSTVNASDIKRENSVFPEWWDGDLNSSFMSQQPVGSSNACSPSSCHGDREGKV